MKFQLIPAGEFPMGLSPRQLAETREQVEASGRDSFTQFVVGTTKPFPDATMSWERGLRNVDRRRCMRPVHIAVTQQVKPGKEREFAEAIKEFARESLGFPGNTGVHLIEPVPGTEGTEFGILRSFESDAARKAFYDSEMFARWLERSASMIAAKPVFRELQGIEAFFPAQSAAPPRWKMAILTFVAVYPSVLFWSVLVSRRLPDLPWPLTVAINNLLVVITLAWGVMPILTKLFADWLRPQR